MAPAEIESHLPQGNYKVVSLALDLTGKKFIDEICTIGAFTVPSKVFSQCIMPSRDVAPSATRKHGLKVFTQFGRYRVLRDTMNQGKSLKTKSAYSGLLDLMSWLEGLKGQEGQGESCAFDGIILAYHDPTGDNTTPFLLQALDSYKLMDKWTQIVKGYCNMNKILLAQEDMKGKSMTLSSLAKKYEIPKTDADDYAIAKRRCALTYKILGALLKKTEGEIPASDLLTFCDNQQDVVDNLEHQRALSIKIQTLRPIFLSQIRKGVRERQRAVQLRKHLIENEVDMATLEAAYKDGGQEEITKIVEKTKASRRKKDAEELVKSIVDYFTKAESKDKKEAEEGGEGESAKVDKDKHHHHTEDSETEDDDDEFQEAKDGEGDSSNCSDQAEK